MDNTALPFRRPKTKASTPRGFWKSSENRRKFFIEFAQEKGFDPMVPENWHNITWAEFRAKKVGTSLRFSQQCYKITNIYIFFFFFENREADLYICSITLSKQHCNILFQNLILISKVHRCLSPHKMKLKYLFHHLQNKNQGAIGRCSKIEGITSLNLQGIRDSIPMTRKNGQV